MALTRFGRLDRCSCSTAAQAAPAFILAHMSTTTPISELPDEDLMLLLARGLIEQPAQELFRRHNRSLFNYLAWMCQGNIHEAEDVTQKAWLKIMTRCADYQPTAAFRTFLYQIAHNSWLDGRRQMYEQARTVLDEALELADDAPGPEMEWHLKQNMQRIHQLLLHLPPAQREAVVLRFFNDMSLEEIALTTGVGPETVKSRLRYAYRRLREQLEGEP